MKLQMLMIPMFSLSLLACGQLQPSKKVDTKAIFGVSTGICTKPQVMNATSFNSQKAVLESISVCAGADATSAVIKSSAGQAGAEICAYPAMNGNITSGSQCFALDGTLRKDLRFAGGSFNTLVLVMRTDQSSYESGMQYGGGGSIVPYATAKFR